MKITRKQLRKLISESVMVSNDPLIMQVTSTDSYHNLVELCDRYNYSLDKALLNAVKERNAEGLKYVGRRGLGMVPENREGQPSYYNVSTDDKRRAIQEIDKNSRKYLNYDIELERRGGLGMYFNPCSKALKIAANEAAKLVQNAIDNPQWYEVPERSFLQKAGSFLTGKGFRE